MFERLKDRVEKWTITGAIVVPVGFVVVAFLFLACFFMFNEWLPPALAALVTAAIGIIVIAVVLVITRLSTNKRPPRAHPSAELPDRLEQLLQENADPVLREWIRNNPDRAAIATLLLGVAAGYSESFQKILLDMYNRYAETETRRRSARKD
ncbi:MAG: hypothetical protein EA419_10860 [Wenzhouxiangella sp.]|nr:MAG: hypothetical protein EA419_10860 [Wenzhouxiangella sp.]